MAPEESGGRDFTMTPPAPAGPRLNPDLGLWEFSRYEDVRMALREPALWPVAPLRTTFKIPDATAHQALRTQVLETFFPGRLTSWQTKLDRIAEDIPIMTGSHLDLVTQFIEPWCLAAAGIVTGAARNDWNMLLAEARIVSHAAAEPLDENLRQWATQADAELADYFHKSSMPMPGPTFVALSRTIACLLANGWLALLNHPAELELLRVNPGLLPRAVEEMLRYAAIPQSVFRHASAQVAIAGVEIHPNSRVVLRFGSANRDPSVFPDPDRFDLARRGPAHLSLGFGEHPCAGSGLIRMVITSATAVFVQRFRDAKVLRPVEWDGGSGFRTPRALVVS